MVAGGGGGGSGADSGIQVFIIEGRPVLARVGGQGLSPPEAPGN